MPNPGPDEREPRAGRISGRDNAERVAGSGRSIAGRYRLDRVLGKGSMGTVWAAYDETLHRRVAIKEIYIPEGAGGTEAANLAERTLREARAIAQLSHPNVITLYDILTLPSGPVIVMEVLAARSLGEVLKEVGPLGVGQTATVGMAVAAGLSAAHAAGITHRDVKPGNVLIGADGRIKLTDFGIARSAAENPMTATGLLLGSPAYIAPEVASGATAGPAADAWGLGALLFACIEGRPPFDKGSPVATLMSVVTDPVPALQRSAELGPVIQGLLQKEPGQRWTLRQARAALRSLATDPAETRLVLDSAVIHELTPPPGVPGIAHPGGADRAAARPQGGGQDDTGLPTTAIPTGPARTAQMRSPWWDDAAGTVGGRAGTFGPGAGTLGGVAGMSAGSATSSRFARDLAAAAAPALPPPPWAATGASALAPLPAARTRTAVRPNRAARWWIAAVVFLTAALIAYFGVLAIADGTAAAGIDTVGAAAVEVPLTGGMDL